MGRKRIRSPEERRKQAREWKALNKEHCLQYDRDYYAINKPAMIADTRARRAAQPTKPKPKKHAVPISDATWRQIQRKSKDNIK